MSSNFDREMIVDQRGMIGGLPEKVLALTAAVIVVAGMMAIGAHAYRQALIEQDAQYIRSIIQNARDVYAGWPTFERASLQRFIRSDIFPDAMLEGNQVRNSFDGEIEIAPESDGDLHMRWRDLDNDVCLTLATKLPADFGIEYVFISRSPRIGDGAYFYDLPVSPSDILEEDLCQGGPANNRYSMSIKKNL